MNQSIDISKKFKNKVMVFDDLIDKSFQKLLKDELLMGCPWYYIGDITTGNGGDNIPEPNYQSRPGMLHTIRQDMQPTSHITKTVDSLFDMICKKIDYEPISYIKTRSFLQFNLDINKDEPDLPHLDMESPHLAIIYYVIDSDGDTIVYDHTLDYNDDSHFDDNGYAIYPSSSLIEKIRVTPKQGRVLVFDGAFFHTSEQPKSSIIRLIINADII